MRFSATHHASTSRGLRSPSPFLSRSQNPPCKYSACNWGGGGAPPAFFSRASSLQSVCVVLNPVTRAFCLQTGGAALRNPRASLIRTSLLQSFLFETHHAGIVFAKGGCAPPPPQPNRIFQPPQACFQACECFWILSCEQSVCEWGAAPSQPIRCCSRASLLQSI